MGLTDVAIVLPSLNPDERLVTVVSGCKKLGFKNIVVVNDGSDESHLVYFDEIQKYPDVTVLNHECNKGKGRALKTAFSWCLENLRGLRGVVTVDGDNQHDATDIAACAEEMLTTENVVLGVRDFSGKDIPWKSKAGNNITRFVFRLFCGIKITDTQTGLRAIPLKYLQIMTEISGERFEYETNMLLEMKDRHVPFTEVKIKTIYEDKENSTSHFHPVKDSFKIYKIIFKYVFSSGLSSVIDILIFFLLSVLFGNIVSMGFSLFGREFSADWLIVFYSTFFSRAISSGFNYKMNRHVVFKSNARYSVFKYYFLVIVQLTVSAVCVSLLSELFGAGSVLKTICKIMVDTCLFFISFRIQRAWVFKE